MRTNVAPSVRRTIAATVIATIGASLPMFLVSALAVEMPALGVAPGRVGAAVAAFSVTTAAFGLPFGHVVARVGWHRVLRWGAAASSASIAMMVFSGGTLPSLLINTAGAGIAFAAVVPATNAALHQVTLASRNRGLAFGVKQASAPGAIALAGLGLGSLVSSGLGWRGTLLVMAVVPLVGSFSVPGRASVLESLQGAQVVRRGVAAGEGERPGAELITLVVAAYLGTAAAVATVTLLPLTLLATGASSGTAGAVVTMAGLASLAGRIGVGVLSDRSSQDPLRLMVALLLLGSSGHALLATGAPTAALVGPVIALGLGWGWPGLFHSHVSTLGVGAGPATGYSIIGLSLGGATGPLLIGSAMDAVSPGAGWLLAAGLGVASATLTQSARRRSEQRRP